MNTPEINESVLKQLNRTEFKEHHSSIGTNLAEATPSDSYVLALKSNPGITVNARYGSTGRLTAERDWQNGGLLVGGKVEERCKYMGWQGSGSFGKI
jgi:hypothetical protein